MEKISIRFEADSKIAGNDVFYKECTEEDFESVIDEQKKHYRSLAKYDNTLTVTACVVHDGEVVYFNQLV